MSGYVNYDEIGKETQSFRKTNYTRIIPGVTLYLRLLDEKPYHKKTHYIPSQRISILCENPETCPICLNNRRLAEENPNVEPWHVKGYNSRSNRYMVNVFNRTPIKKTSNGGIIYARNGQFPVNDPDTGEVLVNIPPVPLNQVEVMERGPTLFQQIFMETQKVIDDAGNPISMTKYDISISAAGAGRNMVTSVEALPNRNDLIEVSEEDTYVLSALGHILEPREVTDLLKGVSLRDIYAKRAVTEEVENLEAEDVDISDDVQSSLDDLFGES